MTSFWYGVFWPYFQFFVFLAFLVYFARKPIAQFLESKRDDFRTKLSEAHEALTLAERKIQQYEAQMASLITDVETIKAQHLQDAQHEKEAILQEANKLAESLLNDARRAANELVAQAQQELKTEMLQLAMAEFQKQLNSDRFEKIETKLQKEILNSIPRSIS